MGRPLVTRFELRAQKGESISIVHQKAIKTLQRSKNKTVSGIIRFPEVYRTLSWLFHLNKREAREFLKELRRAGLIEVVPFNGIRITSEEG